MPLYEFINPENGEKVEVLQSMNEEHVYSHEGKEWNRLWTSYTFSAHGKIDAFDRNAFVNKTANMKGATVGNLMDMSQEFSQMRAEKEGKDPIIQAERDAYSKIRGGKPAPF